MKYKFFYDESEHSRKLTKKTINSENFGSHFVAGVIGYNHLDRISIEHGYRILEDMRPSDELKSSTFKFSQFKSGLVTLNKSNKILMDSFFDFFIAFDLHNYIAIINKLEYVVIQLFKDYKNSIFADMDVLRYVVSKLLNVYKPRKVLNAMYKNDGTFILELDQFVNEQIIRNADIKHKEMENRAFKELSILLRDYNQEFSIDWSYYTPFIGFKQYLDELNIKDYSLVIDKEGEGTTLKSALKVGLEKVSEQESDSSVGVRIADMFTGIISKLIKAVDIDLDYQTAEDIEKYMILSIEWFKLDESSFLIYQKLGTIIFDQHKAHFKSFAGNYSDTFVYFIAFLRYIYDIETFKHYLSIEPKEHQIQVNNNALGNLQYHSNRMVNKLPIKKLENDGKDWFLNQKGAKTYYDYMRHEHLNIPVCDKVGEGIVYEVLNVGFFGIMEQPCLTILEEGTPVSYLLPLELIDWTTICVDFAMRGSDMFPNKVMFHKIEGKYYADVL